MKRLSIVSLLCRIGGWVARQALLILIIGVVFGFLIWLFVVKLGYGVYIQKIWSHFVEFLGFARDSAGTAAEYVQKAASEVQHYIA